MLPPSRRQAQAIPGRDKNGTVRLPLSGMEDKLSAASTPLKFFRLRNLKINPLDGAGHPTPGLGMRASRAAAQATALAVERKFTASLLSHPARSSVAPSRLSKNKPKTPPAQLKRINDGSR